MKLLKEGKEGQEDQSSNQELLNMLGGMNGQAKLDDTRQSRINIFMLYMTTIMTNKVTPHHNKY